jgi:hypothetical protein
MERILALTPESAAGENPDSRDRSSSTATAAAPAGRRRSLAHYLSAPIRLAKSILSARALAVTALGLAGLAIFFGPVGAPRGSSDRLAALELTVRRLETRLTTSSLGTADGGNPATLLVAVQFVTAAAERSTPFDTALAVAISLTGEHPKVGPLLDELLAEAATGVPSLADLRTDFQARLAELEKQGLRADAGNDGSTSFFRLSRLWDWTEPEISAEHQATLQKLSADVANLNIAQAVQLLGKLDGRLRDALEGWREKAQRRVAVDAVLTELRRATFVGLIDKAP